VNKMNPAGITLRELLDLPVLKDAKVISGEKGLDRVVRYIDIMEVPDVTGWLREGELLLTTAYSIRHEPA
jgi:purine catabolism regulator